MSQLVGKNCVGCKQQITSELDGRFCAGCQHPIHTQCARPGAPTAEPACAECGTTFAVLAATRRKQVAAVRRSDGPWPVSSACPECRSKDYKAVKPRAMVAYRWDRVCKECGTRYTPPTPRWAGWIFILLGAPLLAMGPLALIGALLDGDFGGLLSVVYAIGFAVVGGAMIAHGYRSIVYHGRA